MSFGFDRATTPDLMGSEVTKCLNAGIMLFASASNDGGGGSRTYPALYPRVLCIHASNYLGENWGYNPGRENETDNFSTVGEHIRPLWDPSHTSPLESAVASKIKYRDGTSFATPVAVAIAAFMIAWIRKYMPDQSWRIMPWSPEGMTIIFKIMKKDMERYDWLCPTWFIAEKNETLIRGLLIQRLCR